MCGSSRWPAAALLALLAWWTLRLGSGAAHWCFVDFVNLAFHEAGHLFLRIGGETLHYLGGTLGQLVVPVGLAVYFLRRLERPFSAAVCTWWTGESLLNVATYMADARELALPLVGGGDHDWNELFFRFGLLAQPSVERVSGITHGLGTALMALGIVWGGTLLLPDDSRARLRARVADRAPWLASALG